MTAVRAIDRRRLFERLKQKRLARQGGDELIQRRRQARAPLSFAQERLWFLEQLDPGRPRFNMVTAIRLRGELNRSALDASLRMVVRRHEILRTTFTADEAPAWQVIAPELRVALPVIDLTAVPVKHRASLLRRLLVEDGRRPFDLVRGPLMRCLLVQLDASEYVLSLGMHQIVVDRWSRGLFVDEMAAFYPAFAAGRPSPLPEPEIQYADFALWQRQRLSGPELDRLLVWWRDQLRGAPVLDWPGDRPRPRLPSTRGAVVYGVIREPLLERLKALSQAREATLFMTLLAALCALAWRFTGQHDVVLGSPVANRRQQQLGKVMGFFLNMLPLRVRLAPTGSFSSLLDAARETAIAAFDRQDLPFAALVDHVVEGRDLSRHPLFQVTVVLQNAPLPPVELPGLELGLLPVDWGTTAFDLAFFFWETALWEGLEEGLSVMASYSLDLFDEPTPRRLVGHLQALLEDAVDHPERRLDELSFLPLVERHQLVHEWSGGADSRPRDAASGGLLPQLVESRAEQDGDAVALVFGAVHRSYAELNREANRLARYLRRLGIAGETRVAVCLPPSAQLVVALLGILKAGGAYLPLDPDLPAARLDFLLSDAGASLVLTVESHAAALPAGVRRLSLDRERNRIAREAASGPDVPIAADNLAYVIYTSGSNGRPKGVAVPHRAVVDLLQHGLRLGPGDGLGQLANPGFDAATFEIWAPLVAGARVVGLNAETALSAARFRAARRRRGIEVQFLTTALFHHLAQEDPQSFDDLRCLIFGGEAVRPAHAKAVRGACPELELWNAYGPSAATTFVTLHRLETSSSARPAIPIGRPLRSTALYVLDRRLVPVPIGAAGEIWLAGHGLARGYAGRPRATAAAFLPNPFAGAGGRLHRTGDCGRWNGAGELLFCGRLDGQLEVRGFRIEPGEIESALADHPEVVEAVVMATPGQTADETAGRRLTACVASGEPSPELPRRLRAFLRTRLPAYRVPDAFVVLAQLPRSPSGKVDRTALAAAAAAASLAPQLTFKAPRDARETKLAQIFREVLSCGPIGIHEDFFDLGGHSLHAARVVERLRLCGVAGSRVRDLFERPTVAELARWLGPAAFEEPAGSAEAKVPSKHR